MSEISPTIWSPRDAAADARPDFLVRLGVLLPFSEEDVKAAFRDKVKAAHPDHGGSAAAFQQLEEDYQNALSYAELQTGRRSWLAAHIERYTAQEALIAEIRRRGGQVELVSIDWLRREIGDDFAQLLDTIVAVNLTGPTVTIEDVRFLDAHQALLAGLKRLDLSGARIGNATIGVLARLKGITHLDLSGTHISNSAAPRLARLPSLQEVNVGHTFFGLWGNWRLRIRRPDVTILTAPTCKSMVRRRYAWTAATVVVYLCLCFAATHVPLSGIEGPQWELVPFDKVVHFGMYGLLAFLMSWLFSLRRLSCERTLGRVWFHSTIILIAVAAYGLFDENSQPAFGRTYDLLDWAADVAGAICGIAAFLALDWLLQRGTVDSPAIDAR